jgi:hypothetical protein
MDPTRPLDDWDFMAGVMLNDRSCVIDFKTRFAEVHDAELSSHRIRIDTAARLGGNKGTKHHFVHPLSPKVSQYHWLMISQLSCTLDKSRSFSL